VAPGQQGEPRERGDGDVVRKLFPGAERPVGMLSRREESQSRSDGSVGLGRDHPTSDSRRTGSRLGPGPALQAQRAGQDQHRDQSGTTCGSTGWGLDPGATFGQDGSQKGRGRVPP